MISLVDQIKLYNSNNELLQNSNKELLQNLERILHNFKSCIAGGNSELETDQDDIQSAEEAIRDAKELLDEIGNKPSK